MIFMVWQQKLTTIVSDMLMPRKILGRQGLLVGGREMNRAHDIGGRPSRTGERGSRLACWAGSRCRWAFALLLPLAVLSAPAAVAEESKEVAGLPGAA